jgi:hypothetical protein
MAEKFPIATAKKPADLKAAYDKAKAAAKDYGFTSVANLKQEVVAKAMTDKKKQADFIVEIETKQHPIVQLVCDVKDVMRSVIGRKEIKTLEDFKSAKALAGIQAMQKWSKEIKGEK